MSPAVLLAALLALVGLLGCQRPICFPGADCKPPPATPDPSMPQGPADCALPGDACSSSVECCSLACHAGGCVCSADDEPCAVDADCCGDGHDSTCQSGACAPMTCGEGEPGDVCGGDADCVSCACGASGRCT